MKILILSLFFCQSSVFAFEILAPERIQSKVVTAYTNNVILDIYKTIGLKAKVTYISEELINSRIKSGQFDAILSKITDHGSIPFSIKISPPLINNLAVYQWRLSGGPSKNKRFQVGAIKGVLAHTKTVIKHRVRFKGVRYYSTYPKMIEALKAGKINSILLSEAEYQNELSKKLKLKLSKDSEVLYQTNLHHYINTKFRKYEKILTSEFEKRNKVKALSFNDFKIEFMKDNQ